MSGMLTDKAVLLMNLPEADSRMIKDQTNNAKNKAESAKMQLTEAQR